jgi:hypothetical protein
MTIGYTFSEPLKITDENVAEVHAWLRTWWGRRTKIAVMMSKRCPECGSYYIRRRLTTVSFRVLCPFCQRVTVDDPLIPDNDNPPAEVVPHTPGWVRCPFCRKYFSLTDYSWNGERHRTCGQRLVVVAQT